MEAAWAVGWLDQGKAFYPLYLQKNMAFVVEDFVDKADTAKSHRKASVRW